MTKMFLFFGCFMERYRKTNDEPYQEHMIGGWCLRLTSLLLASGADVAAADEEGVQAIHWVSWMPGWVMAGGMGMIPG